VSAIVADHINGIAVLEYGSTETLPPVGPTVPARIADVGRSITLLLLYLAQKASGLAEQAQQREDQGPAIAALVGRQCCAA